MGLNELAPEVQMLKYVNNPLYCIVIELFIFRVILKPEDKIGHSCQAILLDRWIFLNVS